MFPSVIWGLSEISTYHIHLPPMEEEALVRVLKEVAGQAPAPPEPKEN
jgi:hypothetical protein